MPIKTPKFWYRDNNSPAPLIEALMLPLSMIYKIGSNLNLSRQASSSNKISIPVICVGNITAGGSGKTPSIIALHKLLTQNKIFNAPYFLSRGYGGISSNAARCISVHDDAKEVGDEPLLLASHSKTIISVNRHQGAKLGLELGADVILMDDGFQNQSLHKDLSFIVINAKTGFGNKKLIPAGPLREPIEKAMERASAIILIGTDNNNDIKSFIPDKLPIFKASINPIKEFDKNAPYIGFAGLAHPQKFHDSLVQNGMNIIEFKEFADHHPYSSKEMENLIKAAGDNNAKLITTEKDYMRIAKQYRKNVDFFPIELVWENENDIINFLRNIEIRKIEK